MIEESPLVPDPRQRRALVGVLARAFRDNPMNVSIHGPRPGRRIRANGAGLRALVQDTAGRLEARVCTDGTRVLGGFVAAPPGLRVLPTPSLFRLLGCLWHQGARSMDRWSRVGEAILPRRPRVEHWYLAVLGVDPEAQGRGLGGRLLTSLIDELAGRSFGAGNPHPIYLECDRPSSVRFYRARGFQVLDELEVEGVPCWGLGHGFDARG